jgi:AraC family transcriptional regulator
MGTPSLICEFESEQLSCTVSTESVAALTAWRIQQPGHTFIVHLSGQIDHLETEIDGRGAFYDPVSPGEITVVPGGCDYQTIAHGGVVRYANLVLPPFLDTSSGRETWDIESCVCRFDGGLLELVNRLCSLKASGPMPKTLDEDELAVRIAHHLYNQSWTRKRRSRQAADRTRPSLSGEQKLLLREFVHDQLERKLRLADLASLVSLKPNQLLIAFRAAFGTTPAQYLLESRLRRTRLLLRETRHDLLTIGLLAGFGSHSHFTNAFVARFGLPPSVFRQHAAELP